MNKTIDAIPSATMEALIEYRWPGNIRELENVIERAVILSPSSVLRVPLRDLRSRLPAGTGSEKPRTIADVEREHIRAVLKDTRWVLSGPRGAAMRLRTQPLNTLLSYEETGNRASVVLTPSTVRIHNRSW